MMKVILLAIFISFSCHIANCQLVRQDLFTNGKKAYENNSYVNAIKYLYAYKEINIDLLSGSDSKKLTLLNKAILYCEKQLAVTPWDDLPGSPNRRNTKFILDGTAYIPTQIQGPNGPLNAFYGRNFITLNGANYKVIELKIKKIKTVPESAVLQNFTFPIDDY